MYVIHRICFLFEFATVCVYHLISIASNRSGQTAFLLASCHFNWMPSRVKTLLWRFCQFVLFYHPHRVLRLIFVPPPFFLKFFLFSFCLTRSRSSLRAPLIRLAPLCRFLLRRTPSTKISPHFDPFRRPAPASAPLFFHPNYFFNFFFNFAINLY